MIKNITTSIALLVIIMNVNCKSQNMSIKSIKTYTYNLTKGNETEIETPVQTGYLETFYVHELYDQNSKPIKMISYSAQGIKVNEIEISYDKKGNAIKSSSQLLQQDVVYSYSNTDPTKIESKTQYSSGKIISKILYNENDKIYKDYMFRNGEEFMETIYFYDSVSLNIQKIESYIKSELSRIIEYHYDSSNNLNEQRFIDRGKCNFSFKYEYLNSIQISKMHVNCSDGTIEESWNYDNFGNLTKHTKGSNHIEEFEYIYDEKGNWIKCTGGMPLKRVKRQIEYY